MRKWDCLQRKEDILFLAQCIAELPHLQKKLLSLYYLENTPLVDIAAGFSLSEARTCQMLVQSIDLLHSHFLRTRRTPRLKHGHMVTPDQVGKSTRREAPRELLS